MNPSYKFAYPSNVQKTEFVYIRTNTVSALCNNSGQKNDTFAIVPVSGNRNSQPILEQTDSDIYGVVEETGNLKNLQIRLTDEFNDPLEFETSYFINFAIINNV